MKTENDISTMIKAAGSKWVWVLLEIFVITLNHISIFHEFGKRTLN